jgi:hypothetical protein
VIGLVMLVSWLERAPVFMERDWLLLFGHPSEKVFTLCLWLGFRQMLLAEV